jgi:hypothetical protein
VTTLTNPSAVAILDVIIYPTGQLPLAQLPLTGNELLAINQFGTNVYLTIDDLISTFPGNLNFYANGAFVAIESGLNLIEGAGITIVQVDNPGLNRVDVTISTVAGTGLSHQQVMSRVSIGF